MDIKPKALIRIHENLLNRNYDGYSLEYNFGSINSPYGRVINLKEDEDLLIVKQDEIITKFKRVYG